MLTFKGSEQPQGNWSLLANLLKGSGKLHPQPAILQIFLVLLP